MPRAATTTCAPRAPAPRATARPSPLDAPVTTPTCSDKGFFRTVFGCPAAGRAKRYPWLMPSWIGFPELLLLLLVVLLVFGPKRLPEMGRSLGKGMREFKDSITGKDDNEPDAALPPAATPPEHEPVGTASERDRTP